MKYVCTVCGYIYDEEEQDILFSELSEDWKCPLCGAPKSLFEKSPENDKISETPEEKETVNPSYDANSEIIHDGGDMVLLNAGELSILFSNLARGCEKQYQNEAKECFDRISSYFESLVPMEENDDLGRLAELIQSDLDKDYADLRKRAVEAGDRGTLRVITWGEKVSRMAKSLIGRYKKEGDAFLKNTGLYICTVCGFLYVGDSAPEICPVCKVPGWKFEKIDRRAKK